MRSFVILNPAAAGGKTLKVRKQIETFLKKNKIKYELYISKSANDILSVVRQNITRDFSNFVGIGGDGTVHYIANALAGTDKNLGYIPVGSGNDIAKNLGVPLDIEKACKVIKKAKTKRIDLGLINDQYYYLCIAGAGFDSDVTRLANETHFPVKGPLKYTYAVYKTLITFRPKTFHIQYDNNQTEIELMMMVASNMQAYGGGMKITPHADPCDGKLDICIIKKMSKIHFVKAFPRVFEGKHTQDPNVEIFKADTLRIECDKRADVFADGEYICSLPASFKVLPKALNFIVP